jgi:hypothetical protein
MKTCEEHGLTPRSRSAWFCSALWVGSASARLSCSRGSPCLSAFRGDAARRTVASAGGRLGSDSGIHPRGAIELHIHRHRHRHSEWPRAAPNGNHLQRAPPRLLGRPVVQRSAPACPPARACDGCRVRSPCQEGLHASTHNPGEYLVALPGGARPSHVVRGQLTGACESGVARVVGAPCVERVVHERAP